MVIKDSRTTVGALKAMLEGMPNVIVTRLDMTLANGVHVEFDHTQGASGTREAPSVPETPETPTTAGIAAEMRRGFDKSWHDVDREWAHGLAGRLEEAARREKRAVRTLRKALTVIRQLGIEIRNAVPHLDSRYTECLKKAIKVYQTADHALLDTAAPDMRRAGGSEE